MTEIEAYLQNPTNPAKAAALYNQYVKKGLVTYILKKPERYLKLIVVFVYVIYPHLFKV